MKARGARSRSSGVVVGGGLLGLEAPRRCATWAWKTHVVEFAPRLMAVQVDEGGGRKVLRSKIEALGVQVHTSCETVKITDGASAPPHGFADGSWLETDMIVFSAGIRPRDELASQCALASRPARRQW
jgi:nitrite reductase (NADH) large subunit